MSLLYILSTLIVAALFREASSLQVRVLVKNGNSYSNCDLFSKSDPVWAVAVNGESPDFYRSSSYSWCNLYANDKPRYQYSSSFSCSNQMTQVHVCFHVGDDDTFGLTCATSQGIDSIYDLGCRKSTCVVTYLPLCTGGDCSLTISKRISLGGNSGVRGHVNFNIERYGNCPTPEPTQSTRSPSSKPTTSSPTNFPSAFPSVACRSEGESCGNMNGCCVNGTYCNSINETLSICERFDINPPNQKIQSEESSGMSHGMLILVLLLVTAFSALFICISLSKIYAFPSNKGSIKQVAEKNTEATDQPEADDNEQYEETIGDSTPDPDLRITSA